MNVLDCSGRVVVQPEAARRFNPPFLHQPVDNMYAHISKVVGSTCYRIGGQVPVDAEGNNLAVGDMLGQIRACYECVAQTLESLRIAWSDVTHLLIFTTQMDEYMKHETSVARDFLGNTPPPSTLVEVSRLVGGRVASGDSSRRGRFVGLLAAERN